MQTDADSLPLASDFRVGKAKRSLPAFIMSALHSSRQLQARRILSQNRHLIADPEGCLPHESNPNFGGQSGGMDMARIRSFRPGKAPPMQISEDKLDSNDRPLARRWTIGVLGFYGSILLGMILCAQFGPKPDVFLAVHEATGKPSSHGPGTAAPEMARR